MTAPRTKKPDAAQIEKYRAALDRYRIEQPALLFNSSNGDTSYVMVVEFGSASIVVRRHGSHHRLSTLPPAGAVQEGDLFTHSLATPEGERWFLRPCG